MSGNQDLQRAESSWERVDRNWQELLQELRVSQVGIQILTAFLLMLPFQRRFVELTEAQRNVYLVTVCFGVAATTLIIAPVNYHRMVFRRRQKDWLVKAAHYSAQLGLICLACAIVGAVWLVFDFVIGGTASTIVAGAAAFFFVAVWWGPPLRDGRGTLRQQSRSS
jgi:predicted membrane channel-forming protein YqfA (hemolysin III family)